ncbi:hypothetical protein ACLB1G_17710 [Oxalobacteraceae bacterium A2-2]
MKNMLVSSVCAALLLQGVVAMAAPTKSRMEGLRAAQAELIKAQTAQPPQSAGVIGSRFQDYGWRQSLVGDVAGALDSLDMDNQIRYPNRAARPADPAVLDGVVAEDAIKAIVAAARDKRAVLINESHHVPMHRAFTQKLAAELRKIGYTYLACETFSTAVEAQPKYVTSTTGYYTNEPVFAGFINAAIADGWTLVPYETEQHDSSLPPDERMRAREVQQAKNIYERIFAKDSKAKVLVHVGYGHLTKIGGPTFSPMGMLLARRLGEGATLHIDQTALIAHRDVAREDTYYRPLLAKLRPAEPVVLVRGDGKPAVMPSKANQVDMQVLFPDYGLADGRPQWLSTLAGRQPQPIPAALLPASGQRLILAYSKDAGPDAVPIDAVVVEAGKPVPSLMLPKGEVRLTTQD